MNGFFSKYRRILARIVIAVGVAACALPAAMPETAYAAPQKKTAAKKGSAKKAASGKKAAPAKKSTSTKKAAPAKPSRGSGDVRKEQQQTAREIADTKKKISENDKKINRQLNRLNDLDSQIDRQQATIDELVEVIHSLETRSELLRDSIAALQSNDSLLCVAVADGLRRRRVERSGMTPLAFVMSSGTFNEAMQRLNYLNVMQKSRAAQVNRLRAQRRRLESVRAELDSVQVYHSASLKQLATAKNILDSRRAESQRLVSSLRNESASLNKVLEQKNRRMRQLDDELNRIILEEQRRAEQEARNKKPANGASSGKNGGSKGTDGKGKPQGNAAESRSLSGSFASNKGRLLFPVAGKYTVVGTFGRSRHDKLSHVQVDNSGIDISVASGTKARAVFDGTVSSVFFMDGYENIVIVRHGEYLTVYAGLSSISVRKGEKVKTGQTIGTVATSGGDTVLHFEVRKERTKLNPLLWVK